MRHLRHVLSTSIATFLSASLRLLSNFILSKIKERVLRIFAGFSGSRPSDKSLKKNARTNEVESVFVDPIIISSASNDNSLYHDNIFILKSVLDDLCDEILS